MNDEKIVKVFLQVNGSPQAGESRQDLLKIVRKQRRQIRGLKGLAFALVIGGVILAAELAERKRSENYLQGEIDKLKEEHDDLVNTVCALQNNVDTRDETYGGGVSDA